MSGGCSTLMVPNHRLGGHGSSPQQRQNAHFVHSPSRIFQQQRQQRQLQQEQEELENQQLMEQERLLFARVQTPTGQGDRGLVAERDRGGQFSLGVLQEELDARVGSAGHHDLFQEDIDAKLTNSALLEGYETQNQLARQVFQDDFVKRVVGQSSLSDTGTGLQEVFRLPTVRTRVRDPEREVLRGVLERSSPRVASGRSSPRGGSNSPSCSPRASPRGGGKVDSRRVLSPGKFVLKKGLELSSSPLQSFQREVSNERGSGSHRRSRSTLWPDHACDGETSGLLKRWHSQKDLSGWEDRRCKEKSSTGDDQISVPLCPGTPSQPSSSSLTCAAQTLSPDVSNKCILPPPVEPRSVLDLSASPQQHAQPPSPAPSTIRATLPRRFRESFLENVGSAANTPLGSPRTLDFENCDVAKASSSSFDAIMRRDPQFPNLVKPSLGTPHWPDVQTPEQSYSTGTVVAEEFSSLDEWEAATTTSTQHERLAKQWMASLMEDLRSGGEDDSTEECTTPFTPGVESSSPHWLAFRSHSQTPGSPSPSDYSRDENPHQSGGLEYLQVESPGDTPRGDHGFDNPQNDDHDNIEPAVVGHELVTLLLACAEAVSTKSLSLVNHLLQKLGELASPEGTAMQRVAAYFTEGLACRVAHLWPHIYLPLPIDLSLSDEETQTAFHLLNHVAPYTKFAHFTANDTILQAFDGADRVHVIDFDVKQGLQWPALFQSLAVRECGPPSHIRITGIGECKEDLQDTGDRLAEFAEEFNIPFAFHVVIDRLEDVRLWMLHVKENEAVAVNCVTQLHRLLYDSGETIKDFLNLIGSTRPKVVALVEQEGSHNGPHFEGRFLESLQYYSAIFDSLEANLARESSARVQVEQLFAREVRNILSCEGPERVERHEQITRWRDLMAQTGFVNVPLGDSAQTQAQILLRMFDSDGYTLTEESDTLTLGWMDQPLFTASAWKPDKDFVPTGTSLVTGTEKPL